MSKVNFKKAIYVKFPCNLSKVHSIVFDGICYINTNYDGDKEIEIKEFKLKGELIYGL